MAQGPARKDCTALSPSHVTNHGVMVNGSHRLALSAKSTHSNKGRHFLRCFGTSTSEDKRSHPSKEHGATCGDLSVCVMVLSGCEDTILRTAHISRVCMHMHFHDNPTDTQHHSAPSSDTARCVFCDQVEVPPSKWNPECPPPLKRSGVGTKGWARVHLDGLQGHH